MSEQDLNQFPKCDHIFLYNQQALAESNDCLNDSNPQATKLDDVQASIQRLPPVPGTNDHSDTIETPINYQNLFQPVEFYPQYHIPAYATSLTTGHYASVGFPTLSTAEQPWVDEINPMHTQIGTGNSTLTTSNTYPYSWPVDTQFAIPLDQADYTNPLIATTLTESSFLQTRALDTVVTQRLKSNAIPQPPQGQLLSTLLASEASTLRNKGSRKACSALLFDNIEYNGQKSMRVSKTKKATKIDKKVKQEACWRCKRYRKACIGKGVCEECSTADFRVWPSSIGCRRGVMEDFVEEIMPTHTVSALRDLHVVIPRTANWRKALYQQDKLPPYLGYTGATDRWSVLKHKAQSTKIFGQDFSALVDILAAYEHSRDTEIPIWTQSIILLSSTSDFYNFFIDTSGIESPLQHLISATIRLRKSLEQTWDLFLKLCLTGRRDNWFPAFLTLILGICSMVILLDAIPSIPDSIRKTIWADVEGIVEDLRVRQHMMSLDLLRIGTRGSNPLKLDCWFAEEEINLEGQKILKRNPKGMALLGHDPAAFDCIIALREWHSNNKAAMLQGKDMWESKPYSKSHIKAIAALSLAFEF